MKQIVALMMLVSMVVLGGCNTFAGAGKDIERGGEKMQDASKDVQRSM